jgi:hypothetical protein
MLSFPLAVPSQLKYQVATYRARSLSGANVSPFTGQEQIYVLQGEFWEFDLDCPPMKRDTAEEVVAWLVALNGREGSFLLPPPGYPAARGSLAGVPVVMGSGQSGKTLATDGWTPSSANVVKAGDFFQLGTALSSRLYKVVQAASSNVYGAADLEIWPRLRSSPNDNDALTVVSPKGLFRLADPDREYTVETASIYGIRLRVREAI